MGVSTKKLSNVEPLFSVAAMPAAKSARQQLATLLKTNQSVTMNISPVMAEVMLEQNGGNRPLNRKHASRLAEAMRAGDWRVTGQPVIFAKDGTLNDGQHRLRAVVESGMTIRTDVRFGVERDAFLVTDIGNKRLASDALHIAGEKYAPLLAAAIRLAISFKAGDYHFKTAAPPALVMEVLEKNPELREAAVKADRWRTHFKPIAPSTYAFAYHACAAVSPHEANIFFERLATGVDIKRSSDPIYTARRYFINVAASRGHRATRDHVAVIFKAWNAWRKGESRTYLRLRTDGNAESFPIPR